MGVLFQKPSTPMSAPPGLDFSVTANSQYAPLVT